VLDRAQADDKRQNRLSSHLNYMNESSEFARKVHVSTKSELF